MAKKKKEGKKSAGEKAGAKAGAGAKAEPKMDAVLGTDRALVIDQGDASRLWNKGCFGELKSGQLELSLIEALFLIEIGKLRVKDSSGEKVEYQALLNRCIEKYPSFIPLRDIYKDLRARGYIVKTGFKFGTHFRLYPRGSRPGQGHADFLVQMIPEEHSFELQDLSRAVRLSHSVRKKIWYGVVDSEGDITYYEIVRVKP